MTMEQVGLGCLAGPPPAATYESPSSSTPLIWTSKVLGAKAGFVEPRRSLLPLFRLFRVVLCFVGPRGLRGWRAGPGPLPHTSVLPEGRAKETDRYGESSHPHTGISPCPLCTCSVRHCHTTPTASKAGSPQPPPYIARVCSALSSTASSHHTASL